MRRWMRCFNAPALIDRNVDDDRARLHGLDRARRDELGSGAPRNQGSPNDNVGRPAERFKFFRLGCEDMDATAEAL